MIFTQKWKKEAKLLNKGSKKFLNYQRDKLEPSQIDEIQSRRIDLQKSIKAGNQDEAKEAGRQLQATCENALPRYKGNDALTENIEVFFVAIVIALGLRAYYLQPFRIPTGSMRPTLNGFIGHKLDKDEWPAAPIRYAQNLTHGRSYLSVKTEGPDRIVDISAGQVAHFFSRTKITLASGKSFSFGGTIASFIEAMNHEEIDKLNNAELPWRSPAELIPLLTRIKLPSDFTIAEGYVSSGDLVLVDKFSYHFRTPSPGEVFVFDTRKITKIRSQPGYGSHYIKRLIGVPDDKLELRGGDLKGFTSNGTNKFELAYDTLIYRNGEKMKAPGVLRVESKEGPYDGYSRMGGILTNGRVLHLASKPSTGLSEYWAMGDNSKNSSDSRDWGTVKEFNVVGPALFTLWPFGSGHWGIID